VFPLKRSQVQIQRGVGYVYLRRLYQSNRWAEGVPCPTNKGVSYTNLVCWLGRDLKNILLLLLFHLQELNIGGKDNTHSHHCLPLLELGPIDIWYLTYKSTINLLDVVIDIKQKKAGEKV
jgi:hypothetical protein